MIEKSSHWVCLCLGRRFYSIFIDMSYSIVMSQLYAICIPGACYVIGGVTISTCFGQNNQFSTAVLRACVIVHKCVGRNEI